MPNPFLDGPLSSNICSTYNYWRLKTFLQSSTLVYNSTYLLTCWMLARNKCCKMSSKDRNENKAAGVNRHLTFGSRFKVVISNYTDKIKKEGTAINTIEVTFTFMITPLTFDIRILPLSISDRLCNVSDIRGRQVLTEKST